MYHAVLIDDDRWALEDMRETFRLEENGFVIDGAYMSAEAAMEAIEASPPDLIVSDIRMEKLSGLDLVRHLRAKGLNTLVVIVSGYSKFEYAQEALRNGVFDYLLKPLDDLQVQQLMERVLEQLGQREEQAYPDTALGRAMRYIDEHYSVSLPLQEVADQLYLNKNYLSDLFSKQLGMTFTQYKNHVRIEHAKQLLRQSSRSITDIAYATGFNSPSRFSKVFMQMEGISPQQCRSDMQDEDP